MSTCVPDLDCLSLSKAEFLNTFCIKILLAKTSPQKKKKNTTKNDYSVCDFLAWNVS